MEPTRLIVTGWRAARPHHRGTIWHTLNDFDLSIGCNPLTVIHGQCPRGGVDLYADQWAQQATNTTVERHPADWTTPCGPTCHHRPRSGDYCPAAGGRRNQEMVDAGADWLIGFPLADTTGSAGTWDCIRRAAAANIPIWRIIPLR